MMLKSVTNVLAMRGKRQCNTSRRARAALCTKKRRRGASHHRGPPAACGDPVDTIREWSAQLARFPACMSWCDVVAHRVAAPTLLHTGFAKAMPRAAPQSAHPGARSGGSDVVEMQHHAASTVRRGRTAATDRRAPRGAACGPLPAGLCIGHSLTSGLGTLLRRLMRA